MPYSAEELALYAHAKNSLPRFLFQGEEPTPELWGAYMKILDAARIQTQEFLDAALIETATGVWLDQHARDRGSSRQDGETDEALRARLRTLSDAVTRSALLSRITAILEADGATSPTIAMVELRRDNAFLEDSGGDPQAFFDCGFRLGSRRPYHIVVILPYGTSAETAAAVSEYLRAFKAAGYRHAVEVRATP